MLVDCRGILIVSLALLLPLLATAQPHRTSIHKAPAFFGPAVDSVPDVFTGKTAISARPLAPLLLFERWAARPLWDCEPNAPCTLRGIDVSVVLPYRHKLQDGEHAESLFVGVMGVLPWTWDVVGVMGTDTVRLAWPSSAIESAGHDAVAHTVTLHAIYSDPATVELLRTASLLRIRTHSSSALTAPKETVGADAWRQRLQTQSRRLIEERTRGQDSPP
jgi:hypothetical protein